MAYPFMSAGSLISNKTPKQDYIDLVQETLNKQFYNASDVFTIQEETSVGSGQYQNVDVRVNNVINPTTADNVEDDFKKLIFPDLDHSVNLGRFYLFDDNYWITTNVDKIKSLAQTVIIRRCNNVLRWIDEQTGALYEEPCSISYLIKENRDYSTAGSAIVVPSGMVDCFFQINTRTNKIKPNQRFLFGNPNNWTSYRVEGGGINNFNNQKTLDNNSATLGRYGLSVDFINEQTDNLTLGIANAYTNIYEISLNQSIGSGGISQVIQLEATVTLNGETVERNTSWSSSNTSVATVNSDGLVTIVSTGTSTITCSLENNETVLDTCVITGTGSPVDNYQVIFSPDSNHVLEGAEKTWEVYLYKNNFQQADVFAFSLDSNTVPSENYTYTVLDGNSFKIKNIEKFLSDSLEITATSGSYNKTISVNLRGAW